MHRLARVRQTLIALLAPELIGAGPPLPTLAWTGTARVYAGDRVIEIAVDTRLTPFGTAISRSWPISEGPDRARTMIIDSRHGIVNFRGQDRELSPAATEHERQQYALYGLMLVTRARGRCVVARHAGAPDTTLCFDQAGALASGSNTVPDPDTGAPLGQTFQFSGRLRSHGIGWPNRIQISHGGKPYFDLELLSFAAEVLRPAHRRR